MKVKILHPRAKAPTVAHPGEDLGYDLYAVEDTFLIRGRYRGEMFVFLTYQGPKACELIWAGDKIAQLLLQEVHTQEPIEIVSELSSSQRNAACLGSTGR
jgi:dUTPase